MLYINDYTNFINESINVNQFKKVGKYKLKPTGKVDTITIEDVKYFSSRLMSNNGVIVRFNYSDKQLKKLDSLTFYDSNDNKIIMYKDVEKLPIVKFKKLLETTIGIINDKTTSNIKKLHESIIVVVTVLATILAALIPFAIALGVRKYEKWKEEQAYEVTQKELEFFKTQSPDTNEFKVFAIMDKAIQAIIKKQRTSLIIAGGGGVGKTVAVKKAMWFANKKEGKDYIKISGISSPDDLYKTLYEHKSNKILVFDDCETLLKEENAISILKSACDTLPKRTINYILKGSEDTSSIFRTPKAVEFTSSVIIITNSDASTIDRALRSRTTVVNMVINPKLMIEKIESMLNTLRPNVNMGIKIEVMNYLKSLYAKYPKMDFNYRTFLNTLDNRILFPSDWKELTKNTVL